MKEISSVPTNLQAMPLRNMPSNSVPSTSYKRSLPVTSSSNVERKTKKLRPLVAKETENLKEIISVKNVKTPSCILVSSVNTANNIPQNNINQPLGTATVPLLFSIVNSTPPSNQNYANLKNNPGNSTTVQSSVCVSNGLPVTPHVFIPAGTQKIVLTNGQLLYPAPQNTTRLLNNEQQNVQVLNNIRPVNQDFGKTVPHIDTSAPVSQVSIPIHSGIQFPDITENNNTQAHPQASCVKQCVLRDLSSASNSKTNDVSLLKRVQQVIPSTSSSSKENNYDCDFYGKSFSNPVSASQHKEICATNQVSSTSTTQNGKEQIVHNFVPEMKLNLKCSECKEIFHTSQDIRNHLSKLHPDVTIHSETKNFQSVEDFKNWKLIVEKETGGQYIKKSSFNATNCTIEEFACHRYTQFVSESTGKHQCGSIQSDFYCPSSIDAKTDRNGTVSVTYINTHIGHNIPVCHRGISNPVTKRKDDLSSVDSWVKEMQSKRSNPILFYKSFGETSKIFPGIHAGEFLLGYMNNIQEEIFEIYGKEVVSIDSTNCKSKYNIQLTTLVVKINDWEGFPVALLWCSRLSEAALKYFFASIRQRLGSFETKTFMSDDLPAFYNAWKSAFPPAKYRVISEWHIKQAWKQYLSTGPYEVKDPDLQKRIWVRLCSLMWEDTEYFFQDILKESLREWSDDPGTDAFVNFFTSHYLTRTEMWAKCFLRQASLVKESCHRELKWRCYGRLDTAIQNSLKSLQDKMTNHFSFDSGKETKKIKHLRNSHKIAERELNNINIIQNVKEQWVLSSLSSSEEMHVYVLEAYEPHRCKVQCDICKICIHQFRCSCPDNAKRHNMCQHIHLVALKNNFANDQLTVKASESKELTTEADRSETVKRDDIVLKKEIKKEQKSDDKELTTEADRSETAEQDDLTKELRKKQKSDDEELTTEAERSEAIKGDGIVLMKEFRQNQKSDTGELTTEAERSETVERDHIVQVKEIRKDKKSVDKELRVLKINTISAVLGLISKVENSTSMECLEETMKGVAVLKSLFS